MCVRVGVHRCVCEEEGVCVCGGGEGVKKSTSHLSCSIGCHKNTTLNNLKEVSHFSFERKQFLFCFCAKDKKRQLIVPSWVPTEINVFFAAAACDQP